MNNPRIVIDAGHGGTDGGAIGNGIIEKNLTLDISKYMYNRFRELGIPVTMTRTTDETLSPTERVNRIMDAYGDEKGVIIISNHINAGGGDGAEVIYALRDDATLANDILTELEKSGQNVREAFQRRLPSNTAKDYYFIHRDTGMNTEPVIVEYGFLDSTGDDPEQLKEDYDILAEAVVRGVMKYIGKPYSGGEIEGTYTVKSGDSLWSIANRFNTTVAEIKRLNNLNTNALQVGQVLKLPTGNENTNDSQGNTYTVKSGDSLWSIANRFHTTVPELKTLNNLNTNTLQIGQILKLPINNGNTNINQESTYIVKSGDSLWSIARKYDISVSELQNLNNLTSTTLQVGQVLKVPQNNSNNADSSINTYIVKSGDSLWSIANRFGTTVDELKRLNGLNSNILNIGQVLKLPGNINSNQTYIVKAGDSLWNIAQRFQTTVDALKEKNNLVNNNLTIGQVLQI